MDAQLGLFQDAAAGRMPLVGPVEPSPRLRELSERLPPGARLGTSSWTFPGWAGIVYDRRASQNALATDGLAAYAAHPLLRAVGLDRTYYRPMSAAELRAYADVVPDDFRFVVKADRVLTSPFDPESGGVRRPNPCFLDARYAAKEVIDPVVEGLGSKAGPIVFQFSPMSPRLVGGRAVFIETLHAFLCALPKGPVYAVELRTPAFLVGDYVAALEATGAAHCYTVHPAMSPLARQIEVVLPFYQPLFLVRWMLGGDQAYEAARDRYEPFDRLVDEDLTSRELIARSVLDTVLAERETLVIANNKAEGSAPLTLFRLAEHIAEWDSSGGANEKLASRPSGTERAAWHTGRGLSLSP
jgi:uncharacterized protein YecE (DUF72 family)